MEVEIELPEEGSFTTDAGQVVSWVLDKKDRTKCKILVDGKPLDTVKWLEQEAAFNAMMKETYEAGLFTKPLDNTSKPE